MDALTLDQHIALINAGATLGILIVLVYMIVTAPKAYTHPTPWLLRKIADEPVYVRVAVGLIASYLVHVGIDIPEEWQVEVTAAIVAAAAASARWAVRPVKGEVE